MQGKRLPIALLTIAVLTIALSACGSPTPTPTAVVPTVVPTTVVPTTVPTTAAPTTAAPTTAAPTLAPTIAATTAPTTAATIAATMAATNAATTEATGASAPTSLPTSVPATMAPTIAATTSTGLSVSPPATTGLSRAATTAAPTTAAPTTAAPTTAAPPTSTPIPTSTPTNTPTALPSNTAIPTNTMVATTSGTAAATPNIPVSLQVPDGNVLLLKAKGKGVQIYTCQADANDSTKFVWSSAVPKADLFDDANNKVGTHYAGPTWENIDGSKVVGTRIANVASPDGASKSIDWLLLQAKSNEGTGIFSKVTYIQRLNTAGGVQPSADSCDSSKAKTDAQIDYTADYVFWGKSDTAASGTTVATMAATASTTGNVISPAVALRVLQTAAATMAPTMAATKAGTPGACKTSGDLVVGSDASYPPFEDVNTSTNTIEGFDVELLAAIGAKAGFTVKFQNAPFENILANLASGQFDVVASAVTITDERAKTVGFSNTYFVAGQVIVVRQADASKVKTIDDLVGKKIGVEINTTGAEAAKTIKNSTVQEFQSLPEAFQALANKQVDAVVNDNATSLNIVLNQPNLNLVVVGEPFTTENYGFVVRKECAGLQDKINTGLSAVIADGTYAKLYEKYFGEKPPASLMAAMTGTMAPTMAASMAATTAK